MIELAEPAKHKNVSSWNDRSSEESLRPIAMMQPVTPASSPVRSLWFGGGTNKESRGWSGGSVDTKIGVL